MGLSIIKVNQQLCHSHWYHPASKAPAAASLDAPIFMADDMSQSPRSSMDSRPRPLPRRIPSNGDQMLRPGASPPPHRHSPSPSPSHHRQSFTDQLRGMPPSPRQVSSPMPPLSPVCVSDLSQARESLWVRPLASIQGPKPTVPEPKKRR